MAKKKEAPETKKTETTGTEPEGIRSRRAFMLKHLIPDQDYINKEVVAKGKGTKVILGRVFGICNGYDVKTNTLPDGRPSTSIVLKGAFEAESYVTGELSDCTTVYLPAAYAERVKLVFDNTPDLKVVEIDCDLGIEATGKTIPYEWVVVAFREGEEMAILKRLRVTRKRPENAAKLLPGHNAPALEHKT